MATPPFLRYLPARLKPLGNPAVWVPLTVFTLLSAFIWEYHNNPELFNRQPIGSLTPDSNLTPEEEARLSEIDNLDVLMEGARVSENTKEVTGQIQPVELADTTDAASAEGDRQPLADQDNPFAKYEAEYQFAGSANPNVFSNPNRSNTRSTASSAGNNAPGATSSSAPRFNFGDGLINPSAPSNLSSGNSALSDALNRQSADRASAAQENRQNTGTNVPNQATPTPNSIDGQTAAPAAGTISVPFIRTTPNMSPPAGGTGYQAPASSSLPAFNLAPQQVTPNPFNVPSGTQGQIAAPIAPVQPAAGTATPAGTAYTPPTFTQPDQGRAINPRR